MGCSLPDTIRAGTNALMPLRVVYRRALRDGEVHVNPCTMIDLPAVRGRRDRIASRGQAAELIAALRLSDHALWGAAFYAGPTRVSSAHWNGGHRPVRRSRPVTARWITRAGSSAQVCRRRPG